MAEEAEPVNESTSESFEDIVRGASAAPEAAQAAESQAPAAPQRPDYLLEDYDDETSQARAFASLAKHYGGTEKLRQALYEHEMRQRQAAQQPQPQAAPQAPKPPARKWYEYDPEREEDRYEAMVKFSQNPRQAILEALEDQLGPLHQKAQVIDQIKAWRDQQEWERKFGQTWREIGPEWQDRVRRGLISMELIHEQHQEAKKAQAEAEAKARQQAADVAEHEDIKRERAANGRFTSRSTGNGAPRGGGGKKLSELSFDDIVAGRN